MRSRWISRPTSRQIPRRMPLSLPSFMAFAVLATAKFYFAFKGDLGSLMRDAACSLALALASLGAATAEVASLERGHRHRIKEMNGM